jgi:hypothetical protein
MINPSGRKVTGAERRRKNAINSGHLVNVFCAFTFYLQIIAYLQIFLKKVLLPGSLAWCKSITQIV